MPEDIFTALAVCIDAFTAAVTYGISKIKITAAAMLLIAFTGAAFMAAALFAAAPVQHFLSGSVCSTAGAAVLILIAMKNLSDAYCADSSPCEPCKALSLREAAALSTALSADSIGVGFGAGMTMSSTDKAVTAVICLILGCVSVGLGNILGRAAGRESTHYKSAIVSSGVLFVLAIMKLC